MGDMQYTTYLRWGVIAGLFLTLLVPFVVADGGHGAGIYIPWVNSFFPYITGKNFVFRILVEIVLALYIVLALRDPKYRPRGSYIMWALLGMVAWMAVATVFSADPIKSFWSNFERMEGYIGLLHLFAYFVVAGAILTADNLWQRFFNTSVAASVAMGLFALMQATGLFGLHPSSQSGARADASFGNATYLAVYMLINIFITLYLLARSRGKSPWLQSMYGIALVLQFAGVYFTQTRGALLGVIGGLVVGMIWIAIMSRGRELKTLRTWSIGGIVALVVLAGGFLALRDTFKGQNNALGRLASISLTESTTRARLFSIWPMAVKGAAERPLVGWGQENFSYVFNEHYNPDMWNQEQWFDRAHNQFLDWLIAGGFPAFLLYISLFVLAAWAIIRSDMTVPEQAAMLGLLAGYAFNNLFVFDNLMSSVYFMALLALYHGMTRKELPGRLWLSRPIGHHGIAIAAPIVVIVIAVGGWALNAPGMARASTLVAALNEANDPATALLDYNKALGVEVWPGNPLGFQETVEQITNYAGNNVAPSQAALPVKQAYFGLTLGGLQTLMAQRKDDARLELFASGFYAQFGKLPEALDHVKKALALSPGKQQILAQLGLTYLNTGDKQNALATFKQSYEEATENEQALILYAAAEYFVGDTKAGDDLLVGRYGTTLVDDDRLLSTYEQLKLWDRAIAIRKMRVEKNPKDVQTNFALAQEYFAAGRTADTIAQLKKVIQLAPAQAGQLQALIEQIQSGKLKPGQ
jgi:O-antigen ligase/thioredoxin-like negative regulator of GroEL